MKVYYFTIIIIGVMFLLYLGGIQTNSSQVINAVGGNSPINFKDTAIWIALSVALAGIVASTVRVSAGIVSFQVSTDSIIGGFMVAIWGFFASDMYSILTKIGSLSCPLGGGILTCGWTYWIAWAIIVPLMVGYAISIISFINGSD